jgi:beta-galactosidase
MVSHAGEHGRTFREVKRIGAEFALLGEKVADTRVEAAEVAVLLDWNAWWASQQDGRLSSEADYPQLVRAWHRALWEAHTTVDFAHPEHDLSAYKLVVVPQLYLMTDAAIDNLVAYADAGGTLVAGFQTGVADEDDRVRAGGMDARLRDLFGIRVLHEWWPLDAGENADVEGFHGTLWSEEIEAADDVDAVTPYKGGELDGLPAVLRKGRAWYLSTLPEPHALRTLLADIAADAGVRPTLAGLPAGVEAVRRGGLLFLLNHGRDGVTVPVPGRHRDLLTGTDVTDGVELGRYGVAVLEAAP